MMTYEERQELAHDVVRDIHKEIGLAIDAIGRQAAHIKKQSVLLKVLESHRIGFDETLISLDVRVKMLYSQLHDMNMITDELRSEFEAMVIRHKQAEEAVRNQQPQAMCRG